MQKSNFHKWKIKIAAFMIISVFLKCFENDFQQKTNLLSNDMKN